MITLYMDELPQIQDDLKPRSRNLPAFLALKYQWGGETLAAIIFTITAPYIKRQLRVSFIQDLKGNSSILTF